MSNHAYWQAASGDSPCDVTVADAALRVDLEPAAGGHAGKPVPHDLLDAALAACTTLTLQLYAKRKGIEVGSLRVEVTHTQEAGVYRMQRSIAVGAPISDEQRAALLRIAEACPVHKTLTGEIAIATRLDTASGA